MKHIMFFVFVCFLQKPKETCAVFGLCDAQKKEVVELPQLATNKDTAGSTVGKVTHTDVRTQKAEVHFWKKNNGKCLFSYIKT